MVDTNIIIYVDDELSLLVDAKINDDNDNNFDDDDDDDDDNDDNNMLLDSMEIDVFITDSSNKIT